ncbi:MAG: hypothetical protein US42_C0018G0015 [Candidatus Magasanikbacteria bacterium GW2011_GWC2_37_14]|uniref:Uncharacterized protein n=1 Tax=Candidatus Magasanikbacteria bacterium GW2011_GWC2_37_14 TaxID=1619046 RepID=A0A0G0JFL4_9BACT|nr:MAG: hypothetical protein US42_C0018G0015 [Candidatus Magasanikbacteria bacterium GW2011_GWC2_37_14]
MPENTTSVTTKKCRHCQGIVDIKAKKCQHCSSDLRNWFIRHKIISIILIIILYAIGSQSLSDTNKARQAAKLNNDGSTTSTSAEVQNDNNLQVGQDSYLRLPNISDPGQKICLGTTTDDADKITKAMLANDFLGLLEIPGAFCVSNGTKVKLIEKDFPLRRVRIVEGVNKIDSDKVGLSGWVPLEFVVTN